MQAPEDSIIIQKHIETPLGTMVACATDRGICLLEFVDRANLEGQFLKIKNAFGATILPGESPYFKLLEEELARYFEGSLRNFTVPLHSSGTEFQRKVWAGLSEIPYGETRSYRTQATLLGDAKKVRAVASANGKNCLAVLVPCHRVIGSSGQLTGYAGGIWRKQKLLELEGVLLF